MPQNGSSSPTVRIFLAVFFNPATAPFEPIFTSISGHFTPTDQFISRFSQIASFITALLSFLQLKYQGRSESSFATHPRAMNVAVCSYAVHYIACAVVIRFLHRRFAFLAHHLAALCGNVGAASLLSVVLPERAAPFVFAFFGLLSAAEFLIWLYCKIIAQEIEAEHWIRRLLPNLGNTSALQLMRMRLPV